MDNVGDYNIIHDSENFTVLSPSYLVPSDNTSDQEGIDGEEEETSSDIEINNIDYTDYYNNIIDNQLLIESQIDNFNENVNVLNENFKIVIGLNFAVCALLFIVCFWRILNNLLGIGKV